MGELSRWGKIRGSGDLGERSVRREGLVEG